ncbi:MAG: hypothetical protein NT090_15645 [Acidobacteria bacterium]|nr:hypothetical protein [Acidobacteriota bacterium]
MHGLVRRILPSLFALGLTCSGQQWEFGGAEELADPPLSQLAAFRVDARVIEPNPRARLNGVF